MVPIMTGTTSLAAAISALGEVDVEVILAAGKADLSALGALPGNVRSVGFLPLSTVRASVERLLTEPAFAAAVQVGSDTQS